MDGENALHIQKTGHSGEAGNAKELREKHIQQHANPGYGAVIAFSVPFYILKYFIKKMNMIKYSNSIMYILHYRKTEEINNG